jgi:tetratricopeptide (TPR) repeat protein
VAVDYYERIEEIKGYINSAKYREALDRLEIIATLQLEKWQQARNNYLIAYCLHSSGTDLKRALDNYDLALEKGFDEFWVYFNRGALYMELGDIEAARVDLDRAATIDPNHEGARKFREGVFLPPMLDKDEQQILLASPVVVSSVPKSGTILLRNLLKSILGDSLVIPSNSFIRPLATSEYLLSLPSLTNRVYVGHIWYSEDLSKKLSSIPKIVLIRDPRDNVVSYTHFMDRIAKDVFGNQEEYWSKKDWEEKLSTMIFGLNTRPGWNSRVMSEYPSIFNNYLNYALKWVGSDTFLVRYEDIIGTRFGGNDKTVIKTMKSIMDIIGVQIDEETLAGRIAQGSDHTKSDTFRSGDKGNWRQEFMPHHINQMKAVCPTLVSILGYELDENWSFDTSKKEILSRINVKSVSTSIHSLLNNMPVIDMTQYLLIRKESGGHKGLERLIDEWALNIFIENEHYQDAILILQQLLNQEHSNPVWNYLYALSLHQLRKDLTKALQHYNSALENGYEEFWIKYNRGLLFLEMGNKDAAVAELERAQKLKPEHKATRETLMTIKAVV